MKKSSEFVILFLSLIAAFGFFAFLVYYARNPTEQYTPRAKKPPATSGTRVVSAPGASLAGAPQVDMADPSVPMAKKGEQLFGIHCAMCHQPDAKGKVGFAPSIRNRDFLALASDDFIRRTIQEGRPGTAMAPRPDLDDKQVKAIIDFLRSIPAANPIEVEVDWSATYADAGDVSAGQEKYAAYCASCHGPQGQGYAAGVPGTGIGLPGFLKAASDDYIYKTLKVGRIGTPMQPFLGARGLANLEDQDAYDIIAYLRRL